MPRDAETGEHVGMPGLFPCGEGAGAAGGIVSAAMDGERPLEQLFAAADAALYRAKAEGRNRVAAESPPA